MTAACYGDCDEDDDWLGYDCDCTVFDECMHERFDWDVFAKKVGDDYQAALIRLVDARLFLPKPPTYDPMWWVPLSPLPSGLNVRVESHWKARGFTLGTSLKSVLEDAETVWIELGDRSWIATTVMWQYAELANGTPVRELTAVLASQPPDFGWWMPSLKAHQ